MRTVEVYIYKFDELPEKVKAKVINKFREGNDLSFMKDDLRESVIQLLMEYKIEVLENFDIYYSLSHSQGDGLCFTGVFKYKDYRIIIRHKGMYYHYKSVNIDIERFIDVEIFIEGVVDNKIPDKEYNSISDEFQSIYKTICLKVKREGYSIIDNENSDEAIKETIEANEYEFFDNGNIYSH